MKQRIQIIVFMMALAAVFGGAVTALQLAARDTIQRNRHLKEQRQLIGLFDLVLLLGWGLDPLWGFMILPPILFVSVLGWIAFRTGFASDRT